MFGRRIGILCATVCLAPAGMLATQEVQTKIGSVVRATLDSMNSYGWDAVNRGILVNWSRRDPLNRVQCRTNGQCDSRSHPTRHDPQNDIRALEDLYWWKRLHHGDPYYDRAIARLVPTVKREWGDTTMGKGWIYFVLQRLGMYADTPGDRTYWQGVMRHWAAAQFDDLDPRLGVRHGRTGNCACGAKTIYFDNAYRAPDQIEIGAALVSAGTRFQHPDWVAAGWRQVRTVYRQTFVTRYNLFGRIFILRDRKYGRDVLWDPEVKMGEASEEADALIRGGAATSNPAIRRYFWDIAARMLTALADGPVRDRRYGGFYFGWFLLRGPKGQPAGSVQTDVRESRQLELLGTYHIANKLLSPHNHWAGMEAEMLRVVTHAPTESLPGMFLPNLPQFRGKLVNGYPASVAGYPYELKSDDRLVDHQNWVTSEADNLALLGMLEELSPAPPLTKLTLAATTAGRGVRAERLSSATGRP